MELRTNATGNARKKLVGEISRHQNAPTHYDGAPGFGYTVGDYTIDKQGTVTGPDNLDLATTLRNAGFEFEATMDEVFETADGNEEDDTLAIEMPMEGMTDAALENLGKLIESKKQLIKAAIGHDPETALALYPTTDGKLRFEWFPYTTDPDEITAYATLVSLMCKTAREKKRVTAKPQEAVTNPKFSFRVWLISLGMVGDEYKKTRSILLRNLSGNSAFAGGKMPTYTVNCYTLENGNEEDPMVCESFDFHSYAKAKAKADEFVADCESLYFAGCHVENEAGDYLYEITMDGTVTEK
jgi:hypothetical protein